jgi:hypothetical protein
MRLDRVTAEIRPRSDCESVDLGLALVRRDFWRCLTLWWLALGVPAGVAGWALWDSPVVFLMLFWWCKPAGSRMVLLQLSRRLFGEQPTWRAIWLELPRVWRRRFFYRFVWARLSPWMPVTLAVEDLEGLRGKTYQQRVGQMTRRGNGTAIWAYFIADLAAAWFGLAIFALVAMLIPEGQDAPWTQAMEEWDPTTPFEIPLLLMRTVTACVMVAMSLADVFLTGAGFGLYVNTRTWIEGWDVELAFRRLGQRLTKAAGVLLVVVCLCLPTPMRAQTPAETPLTPQAAIEQVKSQKEFVVHKVKQRVTTSRQGETPWFAALLGKMFGMMLGLAAVALVLGFLGWLLWKYRHGLRLQGGRDKPARAWSARVVMGMEVTPESLPQDIPGVAWNLWSQGLHQQALGLLYRGAISRVIEHARVEILEADTEGDCLRRVAAVGGGASPAYFQSLTGVWISLAYAGRPPADAAVERLCREWPYVERRPA